MRKNFPGRPTFGFYCERVKAENYVYWVFIAASQTVGDWKQAEIPLYPSHLPFLQLLFEECPVRVANENYFRCGDLLHKGTPSILEIKNFSGRPALRFYCKNVV